MSYDFRPVYLSPLSIEALQAKLGTLSIEAQEKLDKEAAKKEAKADAKADAALKKKMASKASRHDFCFKKTNRDLYLTF
jgi:hypothetical protein